MKVYKNCRSEVFFAVAIFGWSYAYCAVWTVLIISST